MDDRQREINASLWPRLCLSSNKDFFPNDLFRATIRVLTVHPTKHPDVQAQNKRHICGISDHCPPRAKRKVVCPSGIHGCWLKWRNMDRRRCQPLSAVLSWAVINLVSVKAVGITGDKRLPRSKGEAQQAMELGSKGLRSLNPANLVNDTLRGCRCL